MNIGEIFYIICAVIFGYLSGSICFAPIIARIRGIDITKAGSGNLGGTNAGRVLGKKFGALTIFLDTLKVAIPVVIFGAIGKYVLSDQMIGTLGTLIVALAANLGHCFSLFNKFRGGKAVAGTLGFLIAFMPLNLLCCGGLFVIILYLFKYVSLASIVAEIMSIFFAIVPFFGEYGIIFGLPFYWFVVLFIALNAALAISRHHANIKRLFKGTERKITWI